MLDQAFEALQKYDWGQDRKVVEPIREAVVATHGDADARKELETRCADALKTVETYDAQQFLCRRLREIGTAASVPTLAALLTDEKLSHMARYALESIPAPEAGAALVAALAKVSGPLKVGVISSLGARQDDAAVAPLAALLGDSDPAIAQAAAYGLGAIRSPAAAKALTDGKVSDEAKAAGADAKLACAESLLAGGSNKEALALYKSLASGEQSKQVKLAATRGILACAAKN